MSDCLLMIFVKNPVPGNVKTRLAKDIGIDKALDVYLELVQHTYNITHKTEVEKQVLYSEYIETEDVWSHGNYQLTVQKGNTLGEKMSSAFEKAFDAYQRVVIIGSDCYDLNSGIIKTTFEMLEENDVVVGPAKDGGYYLLGMSQFFAQLFEGKKYSNENVLKELLDEAEGLALSVYRLPLLRDIDTLSDLKTTNINWKNKAPDLDEGYFEEEDDSF